MWLDIRRGIAVGLFRLGRERSLFRYSGGRYRSVYGDALRRRSGWVVGVRKFGQYRMGTSCLRLWSGIGRVAGAVVRRGNPHHRIVWRL